MNDSGSILLLRDDEHACVQADLGRSIFSLTWKGSVPSDAWRRILVQAHMQVRQHMLRSWISDSRQLSGILPGDEAWIMTDFTPRMVVTGLERMALVMVNDRSRRTALGRLVDQAAPVAPFPIRFFNEPEQAVRWIADMERSLA